LSKFQKDGGSFPPFTVLENLEMGSFAKSKENEEKV
jgi:ABC-type branched-subunit amino acid transport system ATPase component